MTDAPQPRGRLVELDEDECWRLLREHTVGRVVWVEAGRPHLVPVNFLAHDGVVWLRTAAYTELGRQVDDQRVLFEVDELDPFLESGVSVVVEGRARLARRLPTDVEVRTWVEGSRRTLVEIEATQISGRRLLSS